jgi:hypothetical protein
VSNFYIEGLLENIWTVRPGNQEKAPTLQSILEFGFGPIEQKFSQGLIGQVPDLSDILNDQGLGLQKHPKIREHFSFMVHKGRVSALSGFERKDVIADEALEPGDSIITRDHDFSS